MLRLPARLNQHQAARLLGFAIHDVHILIRKRLLKPLGNGETSVGCWFSSAEIEALAKDCDWLNRATDAVNQYLDSRDRPENVIPMDEIDSASTKLKEGA